MRARTLAKWLGIALGGLIVLIGAALLLLNTDPGRRFLVDQVNRFETASGLGVQIGRIDGSVYGGMILRDVRVRDPKGVFATAPRIRLDWRPFAYLRNHIDIRAVAAPLITVARLPELREVPADPDAPLLPDLDIDIGRLSVERLVLEPPVIGRRQVVAVNGSARIADRRAQVRLDADARGGGDRLRVLLDAVPDDNRLQIEARLRAPAGGVVAGLAGLDAPLAVDIDGRGDWRRWAGNARARLGSDALADLAITARDGTFQLSGPVRPGLVVPALASLTAPALRIEATAALAERRADTRFALRSAALAVEGQGEIDLARNRFGNLRVEAALTEPAAIAPDLSGRDIRLALLLDGPFARPLVDYRLSGARIAFDQTVLERFVARGRARVTADRILIPVSARAARITGFGAAAGELLTGVAIDGQLAISGDRVLSDNLRIRSDRINATAVVVADLSAGTYRGALQGRINNYLVQGIGLVDLTTDVDLTAGADGGFGLSGRFAARTRRIDNEAVRDLTGGQTLVTGRIDYGADGALRVSRLRLAAPALRISDGGGVYRPDGRLDFRATGRSDQYGPLVVRLTGSVDRPQIRVRAERPNIGIPLSNVEAEVRGTGTGYEIRATGGSAYGPFSADVFVRSGTGPLAVEVRNLRFADIDFRGRVVQTPAGPFAGQLSLAGAGVSGDVRLADRGGVQAAFVSARADSARVPSEPPILIQRALIDAEILLLPDAPQVRADVQAAGVRQGDLLIRTARARIDYRGGRGTAALVAAGAMGSSFRIAGRAELAPDRYRVAAEGEFAGIPVRLASPAVIRPVAGGYALAPATLVLPQGRLSVAGRTGPELTAALRFEDFDLSVFNTFAAGIGLGGRATGSVDFVQDGDLFPTADLRLRLDDFTRSGAAIVSAPVDIDVLGSLRDPGGELRAVFRRGDAPIGRLQARLQPVAAGDGWVGRLLAAPLSGGIRYNGPANVLWSLTGIADQQLTGPVGIAADFGGRLTQPQLTGIVRATRLGYLNETYGTRIRDIRLEGRFTNDRLEVSQFTGRAGDGTVSAQGSIGLSADAGYPIDIRATLQRARLAGSDALGATATGELAITNVPGRGAAIIGEVRLPEARYRVIRQGAAEVATLEGVRRKGEPLRPLRPESAAALPGLFRLDLRLRAPDQLFVSGMGLESEWAADLRVTGTTAAPALVGEVELVRGTYGFAGRRFDLDRSSRIRFQGGINPVLSISASSDIDGVDVGISITGRADNPQIAFTSTPALPQDEVLARILFGESITNLSALQAVQLAAALNSLRGTGGGLDPLGTLRSAAGIDRLRILGEDEATGRGTAIAAGTYISNDIYIEIITDARGFTATQLEVALSRALSVLSQTSSFSGTSLELRYRKDY